MKNNRAAMMLWIGLGLFTLSGANCSNMVPAPFGMPQQRVLPPGATLEQVIAVVNANNARVQSFSTTDASISSPGMPSLQADVAFCRPQLLRMRARTSLTGPELDLGSNNELFWFWVRRGEPPAVFYCRHDEYAGSQARRMIPVEPSWLIEAFGVTPLDPGLPHQGPYPMPGDRLEIRTVRDTPDGPMTKVTVVDAMRGLVVEQHAYDAVGHRVASAVVEQHRRDPLTNLTIPRIVKIDCPRARFSMRVNLGTVRINRLNCNAPELWTMPQIPGAPIVNLAQPPAMPVSARPR